MALSLREKHQREVLRAPRLQWFEVWLDDNRALTGFSYPSKGVKPIGEHIPFAESGYAMIADIKAQPLFQPFKWYRKDQAETVIAVLRDRGVQSKVITRKQG